MKSVDYTALESDPTKADIENYRRLHSNELRTGSYILIAVVVFLFMLFSGMGNLLAGGWSTIISVFWIIVVPTVLTALIYWTITIRLKSRVKLYMFAVRNEATYLNDIKDPKYNGMIFDEGHSRKLSELLVFQERFQIGNYSYVTGSGRSRQTHSYGFAVIELSRKLPHFVLDATSNNTLGLSSLSDSFDRSQKLSLEGDFDRYFTLYAPELYRQDALYVFTPDLMLALITHASMYDIEVVDDRMYFYANQELKLSERATLEPLMKVIDSLSVEISRQTQNYTDDHVVNARSVNQVAAPGMRLKKNNFTIIFVVFIFIIITAYISSGTLLSLFEAFFPVGI